ncbi:DUF692 family multinuclear iron-containing protein [Chitinimonas sp. BJB300]|nr:DUF692 family multinuclear iron-containing protein [Chitinimonas sp. BJB300]
MEIGRTLFDQGHTHFCEILIDNIVSMEIESIVDAIGEMPVAFHIMQSRIIERSPAELEALAEIIRHLDAALNPIYISDHLACFTHAGRNLPLLAELDYDSQHVLIHERVKMWQDLLGSKVYFENYPSSLPRSGISQPAFFSDLMHGTGCGILFDISNAVVANVNASDPLADWHTVLQASATAHFHIAGYRYSNTEPALAIDSHDVDLSQESLAFAQEILTYAPPDSTMVLERDANISDTTWTAEIKRLTALIH